MVYLSLSTRILLDVEALNMTESVGNFVKHRRAPVVIPTENGFILRYVPVISGESLAHAYQEILARIALNTGLNVCRLCRRGVFLKHTDKNVFKESGIPRPSDPKDPELVEEAIVKGCVVEDVGGFLYTDATLKRTSRFIVGYMIPALDSIRVSATEAQFHVRYAPTERQQMIYNIEVGSALYSLSIALDIDGIGVSSISLEGGKPRLLVDKIERVKRVEAALKALHLMITQQLFGAKRSRFYPHWKIVSLGVMVSHPLPLNMQPAHSRDYITDTVNTANEAIKTLRKGSLSVEEKAYLYYYTEEKISEPKPEYVEVTRLANPSEVFSKAIDKVLGLMG